MITDKPKAKHVIFLFMNGGLSQVDSFDPKPTLEKYHGQPMPGGDLQHERKTGNLMKSPFRFKKYGKSGIEVSEIFPHLGECVDDMCFVRSVYTEIPESRACAADDEHRRELRRTPFNGIVAHLRPGNREQEPARLRRPVPRRADDGRPAALVVGVSLARASGNLCLPTTIDPNRNSIRRSSFPTSTTTDST